MVWIRLPQLVLFALCLFDGTFGKLLRYGAECNSLANEKGKDQCDATKFLSCTSGTCRCADSGQIYTYREEPIIPSNQPSKSAKYYKLYSCYSPVGKDCLLKYTDGVINIDSAHMESFVATEIEQYGYSKLKRCVEHAICRKRKRSLFAGFIRKRAVDPETGVCKCESGYKEDSNGLCKDAGSPGVSIIGAGASIPVILAAFIVNQML